MLTQTDFTRQPFTPERQAITAHVVAHNAHWHQVDKAGNSYFDHHVLNVARNAPVLARKYNLDLNLDLVKATGFLHDTVEDTPVTINELIRLGFDDDVVVAVRALTKFKFETYADFINRVIKAGPLAAVVKLADILDHLAVHSYHPEAPFVYDRKPWDAPAYFREKYERAQAAIEYYLKGM